MQDSKDMALGIDIPLFYGAIWEKELDHHLSQI